MLGSVRAGFLCLYLLSLLQPQSQTFNYLQTTFKYFPGVSALHLLSIPLFTSQLKINPNLLRKWVLCFNRRRPTCSRLTSLRLEHTNKLKALDLSQKDPGRAARLGTHRNFTLSVIKDWIPETCHSCSFDWQRSIAGSPAFWMKEPIGKVSSCVRSIETVRRTHITITIFEQNKLHLWHSYQISFIWNNEYETSS